MTAAPAPRADLAVDVVSWRARGCLSGRELLIVGLALLAALLPLIAVDLPPLVDLPNNVARAHIRAQLGHDAFYDGLFVRNSPLVPNAAFDVFCALFGGWLAPTTLGHVFAVLAVLATVSGVLALAAVAGASLPLAALGAALLAHNYSLAWGFLNYQLGVGLALWSAAVWLRVRDRSARARVLAPGLLAVVLYFCHILPLALHAVVVFGSEIECGVRRRVPLAQLAQRCTVAAVQFLLPAAFFLLESPTRGELAALPGFDLLASLRGCLKGLHAGLGSLEYLHVGALGALAVLLVRLGRLRLVAGLGVPVLCLAVASILVPDQTASASCLQQRLPVVAAFLAVAACTWQPGSVRSARAVLAVAGVALATRTVALGVVYRERGALLATAEAALAAVPEGALLYTFTGPEDLRDPWAKYRSPLRHAACLVALDRRVVLPQLLVSHLHHTVAPANATIAELNQHFMLRGTVDSPDALRHEVETLLRIVAGPATPSVEVRPSRGIYLAAVLFPADFVFPADLVEVVTRTAQLTLLRVR